MARQRDCLYPVIIGLALHCGLLCHISYPSEIFIQAGTLPEHARSRTLWRTAALAQIHHARHLRWLDASPKRRSLWFQSRTLSARSPIWSLTTVPRPAWCRRDPGLQAFLARSLALPPARPPAIAPACLQYTMCTGRWFVVRRPFLDPLGRSDCTSPVRRVDCAATCNTHLTCNLRWYSASFADRQPKRAPTRLPVCAFEARERECPCCDAQRARGRRTACHAAVRRRMRRRRRVFGAGRIGGVTTGRSAVIVQHDPEPLKFERRYHIVCW